MGIEERFREKVDMQGPDDCWEWVGGKNYDGYGEFNVGGKNARAHRLSFMLAYGPLLEGELVCHRCNNPGCVNPRHLYRDDPAGNAAYMAECGRSCRGTRHPNSRLAEEQVLEIRGLSNNYTTVELGKMFGVTNVTIGHILRRITWKWLQ